MGELRLTPFALYSMTIHEFNNALNGARRVEEARAQKDYEIGRMVSYFSILGHTKKGKLNRPSDLMKFPWERTEQSAPKLEDVKKSRERLKRFEKKNP